MEISVECDKSCTNCEIKNACKDYSASLESCMPKYVYNVSKTIQEKYGEDVNENMYDKMSEKQIISMVSTVSKDVFASCLNYDIKDIVEISEQRICKFLNSIKQRKSIDDYSIDVRERVLGWRDLYPNFFKRIMARLAVLLNMDTVVHDVKWYHRILFPYTISSEPIIPESIERIIDDLEAEEATEEDIKVLVEFVNQLKNDYTAEELRRKLSYAFLEVAPKSIVECSINLKPMKAIEFINIQINVSKNPQNESDE